MKVGELTPRERDVLILICEGLSNRAIADRLVLSVGTVKWYNKQIFAKLEVSNRTEATVRVRELGIFPSAISPVSETTVYVLHQLPNSLTPFVGRKHELQDLETHLLTSRLITVTGTGGIGKTRLAQEAAKAHIHAYPDGVAFVSLGETNNPDGIIFSVAEALGFQFQRGSEPLQQLLDYLRRRRMLLILDNFEHLLEESRVVAQLLTATESVSLIVTSREPLNIYGEVLYTVQGLSILTDADNDETGGESEAADLFIRRAKAIYSSFKPTKETMHEIVRICELVEGMPLAIELAATWVDSLQLSEIVEEITQNLDFLQSETHDTRHGHHSMRATLHRSWMLLDSDHQMAFRRIAVFSGSFNREAAQAIVGVHFATLKALVRKSVLHFDSEQGRYHFHSLLHQFAYEKLEEADEARMMRERHGSFFAAFADQQWQAIKGEEQSAALPNIDTDIENIRSAWDYWMQAKNMGQLKKLFHAVWFIYDVRGWYPAGVSLLHRSLDELEPLTSLEAKVCLGWLTAVKGIFLVARSLTSREAYDLCLRGVTDLRELNQKNMLLVPLLGLFKTALQVGEPQVAYQSAEECLQIATEIQDLWGIVKAQHLFALLAIDARDYEVASAYATSALKTCKRRNDRWSEGMLCIEVLATIAIHQKAYGQAREWLEQGLEAAASIHFVYAVRAAYFQLGYVAVLSNDFSEAAQQWNKALAINDQVSLGTTGFWGKEITGDYPASLNSTDKAE